MLARANVRDLGEPDRAQDGSRAEPWPQESYLVATISAWWLQYLASLSSAHVALAVSSAISAAAISKPTASLAAATSSLAAATSPAEASSAESAAALAAAAAAAAAFALWQL